MSGRRRFLSGVKSGGGADIVYGNQIVAWYEVTENDWDESVNKYIINLFRCNNGIVGSVYNYNIPLIGIEIDGVYKIFNETHYSYTNGNINFDVIGIKKIIYVFDDNTTNLYGFFSLTDTKNVFKFDLTNFNSKIVSTLPFCNLNTPITEIIGTIDCRNMSTSGDGLFPCLEYFDNYVDIINFGMKEDLPYCYIVSTDVNVSEKLFESVVNGMFDRVSAGYPTCSIGFFNKLSNVSQELQDKAKSLGYTWTLD